MRYELTNSQRNNFFYRMAIFSYERASLNAKKDGLSDDEIAEIADDLALAEKELKRYGLPLPVTVEYTSPSVNYLRNIANNLAGSWILVEAATGNKIEQYDEDMKIGDFIDMCKEVAKANDLFLQTALGLKVSESGEVVAA